MPVEGWNKVGFQRLCQWPLFGTEFMSLAVVRQCLQSTLSIREAIQDLYQGFQEAEAQQCDLIAVVGSRITRDRRGRILRWTGQELLMMVLTESQCWGLRVDPNAATVMLDSPPLVKPRPPVLRLTISDVVFDNESHITANSPITGRLLWTPDSEFEIPTGQVALEMRYYHPAMKQNQVSFFHLGASDWSSRLEIRFEFPPILEDGLLSGPIVVFLHALTAEDWAYGVGIQRVSNVVGRVVGGGTSRMA